MPCEGGEAQKPEVLSGFVDFYGRLVNVSSVEGVEELFEFHALEQLKEEFVSECGTSCIFGVSDRWRTNYYQYLIDILIYMRSAQTIYGIEIVENGKSYDVYIKATDFLDVDRQYGFKLWLGDDQNMSLKKILISPERSNYSEIKMPVLTQTQTNCLRRHHEDRGIDIFLLNSCMEK